MIYSQRSWDAPMAKGQPGPGLAQGQLWPWAAGSRGGDASTFPFVPFHQGRQRELSMGSITPDPAWCHICMA